MIMGFRIKDEALVMGAEEEVIGLGTLYRQRYQKCSLRRPVTA